MNPIQAWRQSGAQNPPHIITLVLMAGLTALSMNIFLPSLPAMALHFKTDYAVMQLSVSIYLAVTALMQLVIGPLADRFGRRPVVLVSILIFLAATAGTLLSRSAEAFLFWRMVQACIASGIVLSRTIVRDMYPQDQAASMIGYVTMGMALVPMVGPLLGGALDEAFGWQASFVALLLCGIGLYLLCHVDLGETAPKTSFSFRAQFRDYPELFKSRRFWGYCLSAAFSSGAFFAYLGGTPYVGTHIYDMPASVLGFYFGAPALGYMFGNYLSGRLSVKIGINGMLVKGVAWCAAGAALAAALSILHPSSPVSFFAPFVLVGVGNGMALPSANAGMLSVRPHLAGTAAGIGGAIMIGGGSLLSALAGVVSVPDHGLYLLLGIMVVSCLLAIASALWTLRIDRIERAKAEGEPPEGEGI